MIHPLDALAAAIVELQEDAAVRLAEEAFNESNTASLAILQTCQQAMRVIGERYERGEYYLAALILAGEIFTRISEIVWPAPVEAFQGEPLGRVVLGTVAGDIHDIGKNMFGQSLRTFGIEVIDLGVDVPKERFLEAVRLHRPDIVCLSGLISIAFENMKQTVDLLVDHSEELGYMPPVVIGGGTVDNEVCRYAGADSWSTDAMEGVRICERFLRRRNRPVR